MTPDQYRSLVQQLAGALKDAVAALGGINSDNVPDTVRAALTAAKEALEQPVPSTAGEREAFEAWFRSEYHGRLDRNMPDKSYNDPAAHSKWDAWQARAILAAASSQPVREPAAVQAEQKLSTIADIWIDDENALSLIRDMVAHEDGDLMPIRLLLGDGHSGHGLYIASADYPEEGAHLIAETPPLAAAPEVKP